MKLNHFLSISFAFAMAYLFVACDGEESPLVQDGANILPASINEELPEKQYNSGDVVFKSFKDKDDQLWFCTSQEGVYRYDGSSFTHFHHENGLTANEVSDVSQDSEGNLWFATDQGLCVFDGQTFEFIALPEYSSSSEWLDQVYPVVNPNAAASVLCASNGTIWVGSNGQGAFHYTDGKFTPYLQEAANLQPDSMHHNVISCIVEDSENDIWFGSFCHGAMNRWDGKTMTRFDHHQGLEGDMINSAYIDPDGTLWIGTRGHGMAYFDGSEFITIVANNETCENNMPTVFKDSRGTFWMASYARSGVCTFDGSSFLPLQVEGVENLIDIKCISEDKLGNIWFGGRYGLLYKYDGSMLENFTHKKH